MKTLCADWLQLRWLLRDNHLSVFLFCLFVLFCFVLFLFLFLFLFVFYFCYLFIYLFIFLWLQDVLSRCQRKKLFILKKMHISLHKNDTG